MDNTVKRGEQSCGVPSEKDEPECSSSSSSSRRPSVVVVRMSEAAAWEAEADQVTVLVSDKPTLLTDEGQHQGKPEEDTTVREQGQQKEEEERDNNKRKKTCTTSLEQEEEDEEERETTPKKKKKKYQVMDDAYRLNRTMRDKDFKLGRSSYYSFKDTLGDWDERSTLYLLHLIGKHPYTHFLLPTKTEKRLVHWERVHTQMEEAGYNFTILQLRMRWREVLQKYRWTVDYNDQHKIQKTCEFFDEMNDLFGDWDGDATKALLRQMHLIKSDSHTKKIVRIGFAGWQRITDNLCSEGHRFTVNKVEGRWRNLVTLYKTSVDRNSIPNVEPCTVAFHSDLQALVRYIPQRRLNYERKMGRSVIMERFPATASRALLQAYQDSISGFMNPNVNNREVWDDIRQRLESAGHRYSTVKLKEILTGMIKGYENCQHHNGLPGAIRRHVPFYRELSEVFGVDGRWPHLHTSRTVAMKTNRKFKHRLQVSQQLWTVEESHALLEVYPGVLESHASSHGHASQPSHLWLQLAKAYAHTGHAKRDVPEVAVHIGLLRQGYTQANKFPFVEEMRRVKETEEAVCYSPDVSKFTGDVEIPYWSHEAVGRLLDLYLHHQATSSPSTATVMRRADVLPRVTNDLQADGYRYTKEQVREQFHSLLTQYNARNIKPWMPPPAGRQTHNPVATPYLHRLQQVLELRRSLSLSWTTGVKPLSEAEQQVVLGVARDKAEEEVGEGVCVGPGEEQRRVVARLVEAIVTDIRTQRLIQPVPRTRQVRLHLADILRNFEEEEEREESDSDARHLHYLLSQSGLLSAVCDVPLEATTYSYNNSNKTGLMKKRKPCAVRKYGSQQHGTRKVTKRETYSDEDANVDSSTDANEGWVSNEEEEEEEVEKHREDPKTRTSSTHQQRSSTTQQTITSNSKTQQATSDITSTLACGGKETHLRRKHCGRSRSSDTSATASETDARSGNEYVSLEEDDEQERMGKRKRRKRSESQKSNPETKVIQTRSGRRTRFTFFSRTLVDDDAEEENASQVDTQRSQKMDSDIRVKPPSTPRRKRGRPRKVKDREDRECVVLRCKVVEDAEEVEKGKEGRRQSNGGGLVCSSGRGREEVCGESGRRKEGRTGGNSIDPLTCRGKGRKEEEQLCEKSSRRRESKERGRRKEGCTGDYYDPLIALIQEQEARSRKREENLMLTMKHQQALRNTVLNEMLNVLHGIKAKIEKS
ncbi:hypothetical protein Pmani_009761 [Petrolisthes manimaculis]|uniref:Myb/SANT-like DNA-binding domain-containing protein n=1 Tax=Petrolisthes manimaculis TaxID=1843537 RepID=A0AAE1Q451_9EUCA|nr:hypothetical protein Pmani_009761 [Petrolisthes manimaculis]